MSVTKPYDSATTVTDVAQAAATDVSAARALGTIRRAVEELTAQGLVVVLPAKGTFVTRRPASS